MIITLSGSSAHLLQRRLQELTDKHKAEYGELAIERLDAAETEPNSLIDAVQSLPFLASRKLVIIRGLSGNPETSKSIEQLISSVSPATDVIIYEPEPDKRTAFFKSLKSQTKMEIYDQLGERELVAWLVEEAEAMHTKLSQGDASYLLDRIGPNQDILFKELEKLSLASQEITRSHIDQLTEATPLSKVFDLIDAIFAGNHTRAASLYEDQKAQQKEPQVILAMITWQLHILALVQAAGPKPVEEISADSKIKPYPLQKAGHLTGRISEGRLKELITDITEIDFLAKSYRIDLDEALRNFVLTA